MFQCIDEWRKKKIHNHIFVIEKTFLFSWLSNSIMKLVESFSQDAQQIFAPVFSVLESVIIL